MPPDAVAGIQGQVRNGCAWEFEQSGHCHPRCLGAKLPFKMVQGGVDQQLVGAADDVTVPFAMVALAQKADDIDFLGLCVPDLAGDSLAGHAEMVQDLLKNLGCEGAVGFVVFRNDFVERVG